MSTDEGRHDVDIILTSVTGSGLRPGTTRGITPPETPSRQTLMGAADWGFEVHVRRVIGSIAACALAVTLSGCVPRPPGFTATQSAAPASWPAASVAAEHSLYVWLNSFRAAHGRRALAVHPVLVNKARFWSAAMAIGGCRGPLICHSSLTAGITVHWSMLGENVGAASPRSNVAGVENAFVHSPPHAANMLNAKFNYVGIGVAFAGNNVFVTEEFMASP